MKLSQVVENINKSKIYLSLLDGLELMIKPAPENDKKEMIKEVIKYGKELATTLKNFSGSNEYLQTVNLAREGQLEIAERRIKELEIELERYKKGI